METKSCSKCGLTKPFSEFYKLKRWGGRPASQCKACMAVQCAKWYADNHEKGKADRRAYYWAHKEERKAKAHAWRIKTNYGVEDYAAKLKEQGGGCAICGKTEQENGKRLHVDHNHSTGKTRDLLCQGCNHVLGLFHEDAARFEKAAAYLRRHSG